MLHLWRHPQAGEVRLYIRGVSVEAWISPNIPQEYRGSSVRHGRDWGRWVRSGEALTLENRPARVQVQGLLRAWLPLRYRRPLVTPSFGELCDIARRSEVRAPR